MLRQQISYIKNIGYKVMFVNLALGYMSAVSAANIFVDALPDQPGCDLVEAIIAANNNAAVGGCSAGSGEEDTIIFESFFDEYTISEPFSIDTSRGANATPLITSKIKVVGSSAAPLMKLTRVGVNSRLFDVTSDGDLTLENLLIENWRQFNNSTFQLAPVALFESRDGLKSTIRSFAITKRNLVVPFMLTVVV